MSGSVEERVDKGPVVRLLIQEGYLAQEQINYALRVQSRLEEPKILLDVLVELNYLAREQIKEVIRQHIGSIRIGDLLVELGQIQASQLDRALEIQSRERPKRRLGEVLVGHHFINEKSLLNTLSMQLGVPLVEPQFADIEKELIRNEHIETFKEYFFLPIGGGNGRKIEEGFSLSMQVYISEQEKFCPVL